MKRIKREDLLDQMLREEVWDVLIVGGGATGLGAAVDAASRGYKTLVVEKSDFAKGTSSRSTKLVHGGVRYLAQGDISLVLDALEERGLLMKNAPHLVKNLQFVIPNYEWWGGPFYAIGLKVYDMMAGKLGFGPSEYISKEEVKKLIPNLVEEDLKGGVIYHDGQFDDSRLAVNLAQTALEHGACLLNYCELLALGKNDEGMLNAATVIDKEKNKKYTIRAKTIINACGVFVDDVVKMDEPERPKKVVASQGIHLVLDPSFLEGKHAIMIPKTSDGRVLFAVPWHNKIILGTTDTLMDHIDEDPKALDSEIDFILSTAGKYLNKAPQRKDVLSAFAGLRPLAAPEKEGQETKEISRNHKISVSLSGLITIIGGKWTTYRQMGEDLIDKAKQLGGLNDVNCKTKDLAIHGFVAEPDFSDPYYVYGSDKEGLLQLIASDDYYAEYLDPQLPYQMGQVVWAVRYEMAMHIEDVIARRLRALFLEVKASVRMAPKVAECMARELGKDESWINEELRNFNKIAESFML
jgi:glycerol-3-phosphate dehydrogenase